LIFGKIERDVALRNIDTILQATDGIMIARGDLGVETPIEGIAIVQKMLIRRARRAGKLIITATQMLESMVGNPRPTRAEATDVANAILDGTDCVMLSEESAMGKYPVQSVEMLASIASATETVWRDADMRNLLAGLETADARPDIVEGLRIEAVIAADAATAVTRLGAQVAIVATTTGRQASLLASHRLPCWVVAFSPNSETCQKLNLCSGVFPVDIPGRGLDWEGAAQSWCKENGITEGLAVITHRWAGHSVNATNRLEIVDLRTYFAELAGKTGSTQ
jgi:pyruvate kinase